MTKKVTIKDVARVSGFSHATVSMVLSGESRISEKTREKVLEVARKMKYVPNIGASNLRSGKTRLIGLIVNDLSNPVYGRMAQVAETVAVERAYQLIIADHQWDPEAEVTAVEKMISFDTRGILLCCTEQSKASIELLNRTGSPAVVALDSWPSDYTGAFIGFDVERSGRMAAQHLLEVGCRNPVLFTGPRSLRTLNSFVRLQRGFLKQLEEAGLSGENQRVIYSGLTVEDGRKAFHQLLATAPEADGIFCINDLCAYGVLAGADEVGVEIGKDIAILGVGDHPLSALPRISLTTIRQSPEQLVRMAMEALIEGFECGTPPTLRYTLPPELVIRKSSRLERKLP
jgi:LacI family transcriptional regulator